MAPDVKTIIPNAGDNVGPDAIGQINIVGGNDITTTGTAATNTLTIDITGTTNHAVQIGDATGGIESIAVGTDGQVLLGATAADPAFATLTSANGTIAFTPGANALDLVVGDDVLRNVLTDDGNTATPALGILEMDGGVGIETSSAADTVTIAVNDALQTTTGFESWGGAGAYFDDTTLGDFTLLRPGTGYINTVPVSWTAPQTVSGLTAGNTYFVYVDSTGTLQKTTVFSDALYHDNIVLFQCLRDSTPVTNNQITVKENHPFQMPVETSLYLHKTAGTVIENYNNGANITLNGTQKIQINGDDVFADHGLETVIPDSAGVGVSFRQMYTTAGGKWATDSVSDTFTGRYNNAGTPTALSANRFAVYRLYVSKDSLNATTPSYFAVLHTAQFTTVGASNTAIANGTIARATNELAELEVAQLGYIVYSQASSSIVNVVIEKATLRSTLSTAGTSTAALVNLVTSNFDGILSAADTNVQTALETIDEFGKNLTDKALVVGNGNGQPLGVIAVGATGETLMGNTANDPVWTGSPSFSGTATAGTGLTATTGNVTATSGNLVIPTTTSTVGQIVQNGTRLAHTYGTNNTFVGQGAGNFTLTTASASNNTSLGKESLKALTSGDLNTAFGTSCGIAITTGRFNNLIGHGAGLALTQGTGNNFQGYTAGAGVTTGLNNTAVGMQALPQANLTGSYNTALGWQAAVNYATGGESSNVCIANAGVNGESNKMRLGTDGTGNGQVDTVYLAGTNANISTAATAGTVNIATGAAAKTVTLGSTNTTSKLDLKFGTADFSIASATGTVMSILDTGEVTKPLQSAFLAWRTNISNVTGDSTVYKIVYDNEIFDQNSDFNTSTGEFTASVTGRYYFGATSAITGGTTHNNAYVQLVTSNRSNLSPNFNPNSQFLGGQTTLFNTFFVDMDAGDTAYVNIQLNGATKVIGLSGANSTDLRTYFYGYLVC